MHKENKNARENLIKTYHWRDTKMKRTVAAGFSENDNGTQ